MAIYHYCSVETFHAIIHSKTLRLSDITKSNDSMELMWIAKDVKEIFMECFDKEQAQYFKKGFSEKIFEELIDHWLMDFFDKKRRAYEYFVSCFSKEPDMLSQWRGYADDGKGVSIGIDNDILAGIGMPSKDDPISSQTLYFGEVLYSENKQKGVLKSMGDKLIESLKLLIKSIDANDVNELRHASMPQFNNCFLWLFINSIFMKNPFFIEEKESRLGFWTGVRDNPHAERIILQNNVKFKPIASYVRNGRAIQCLDLDFSKCESPWINEIILGPKSAMDTDDIIRLLVCNNFDTGNIVVRKSAGTYM